MRNHKIWNVDQYEPEIIEKTIRIYGQDGYEMTHRKVTKIEEGKKVKQAEYSCNEDNDTSGLQNHDAEDDKMVERNDADESNYTDGEEKDITGKLWILAPMSVKPKRKEAEKTVHCELCAESFLYESGLRTHMDHAHANSMGNANDILADKISRQEQVLATIPKAETKK